MAGTCCHDGTRGAAKSTLVCPIAHRRGVWGRQVDMDLLCPAVLLEGARSKKLSPAVLSSAQLSAINLLAFTTTMLLSCLILL